MYAEFRPCSAFTGGGQTCNSHDRVGQSDLLDRTGFGGLELRQRVVGHFGKGHVEAAPWVADGARNAEGQGIKLQHVNLFSRLES